ncbi:MAG: LytTR family DNA-binding domain-containing protein [Cyclobacteriaceae bacterium]
MIKCIVIDDEVHCLETMSMLLKSYCPGAQLVDTCRSAKSGIESIEKLEPDLVFLDVEMPVMNGFEMLEQFSSISFSIVFTTSYDQYAIKAIRFSAMDYLLKPIDPKELVSAIHKVTTRKDLPSAEQFKMLKEKVQSHENGFTKIAVPTSEGFELVPTDTIISIEADDNYTHFCLTNHKKVTACRTLKEVEELLESFPSFIRVHHSFMVNLNEVTKYVRGEGGYLVMTDGSSVNVSRSRKDALLKFLGI